MKQNPPSNTPGSVMTFVLFSWAQHCYVCLSFGRHLYLALNNSMIPHFCTHPKLIGVVVPYILDLVIILHSLFRVSVHQVDLNWFIYSLSNSAGSSITWRRNAFCHHCMCVCVLQVSGVYHQERWWRQRAKILNDMSYRSSSRSSSGGASKITTLRLRGKQIGGWE